MRQRFGIWKSIYSNLRIKNKMFVLITILMLSVCLSSLSLIQYAFDQYDEEIYLRSSQSLLVSSYSVENELLSLENLSYRIATDSLVQSYLRNIREENTDYSRFITSTELRERMLEMGGSEKFVISMQMFDINDFEYGTGTRPITTPSFRKDKIKESAASGQGAVRWVMPDEHDEALIAAREIRSYQNLELDPIGYIAVRIDVERLFATYSRALDIQGTQLVIMNGGELVFPKELPQPFLAISPQLAADQGYQITVLDGERYFVTHMRSNYSNWTYRILIPYDTIFRTIVTVKNLVVIFFILIFILALLLSVRFARGITRPIESLNAKMKRVRLGHFTYGEEEAQEPLPMDEAGQMHRNFRIMLQRIDELINENFKKQLMIRETEFKALQAQINPHFLYNTLESINWMSKMAGQPRISQMVESLGFLLRSSISSKKPFVTLREEMSIVEHYITIQKVRYEERIVFRVRIPEPLGQYVIPKLTLQPLIENAIQYGLEQMTEPCIIQVEAKLEGGNLVLTVEDNGPGISADVLDHWHSDRANSKGTGLGLRNIHERIRFRYGEEYGLHLHSDPAIGTRVTAVISTSMEG